MGSGAARPSIELRVYRAFLGNLRDPFKGIQAYIGDIYIYIYVHIWGYGVIGFTVLEVSVTVYRKVEIVRLRA